MKYFYENYRVNMRIDTLAKCKPTYHLHLHKIYQIRVNVQKCLLPYTYIRYKILRSFPITNMINTTKWNTSLYDVMIYLVLSYIAIKISIGSHIVLKHFSLAKPWGNANQTWDHYIFKWVQIINLLSHKRLFADGFAIYKYILKGYERGNMCKLQ